ncbi:hypothetical protein APHAL10511_003223 [Amanita phalloides]|nr:hypothetical protein APHAL10511_003223 [Amanita phalloides]
MVILAELKMHIHDEHAQKDTKKRLKRVFQVHTDAERAAAPLPSLQSPHTAPLQQQPVNFPEALATDTQGSDAHDNNDDGHGISHSQLPMNSFRSMMEQQSQSVDDDDTDSTPVRFSSIGLTPIKSLFDFSCSHWVDMYSKTSIRGFDEELKLYEMLDLDAEGEDDVGIDVDDDTGDVLMG